MKKSLKIIITTLFIFATIISPLSARFETWPGIGLIAHTANLDKTEKHNFGTVVEDTSKIENIIFIGPSFDISLFPEYRIPIGLKLSSQILFPVGYNSDNEFRSYHGDLKNRNMISLNYSQSYGNWGIFADFGYEFSLYRISQTNKINNKQKTDYNTFTNQSLFAEIGLLTLIDKGYFKFGFNYTHSIINQANSHDLVFAGGYRF